MDSSIAAVVVIGIGAYALNIWLLYSIQNELHMLNDQIGLLRRGK